MITTWVAAASLAAPLVPVSVNGPRCGLGPISAEDWRIEGSCNAATSCDFDVEVPLGGCGLSEAAVAYLSGWETYNRPTDNLTQTQVFGLALESQRVDTQGPAPVLRMVVHYESQVEDGVPHDLADFAVWFEVLSYKPGDVDTLSWTQSSTDPGDRTSSKFGDPSFGELGFVGMTSFRIAADRTGAGRGVNLAEWGVRSSSEPYAATTGVVNSVDCVAAGDHGFPNDSTSCTTSHVAFSADPQFLERASVQPVAHLRPVLLGPRPVSPSMIGVGSGHPTCALSAFTFRSEPAAPAFKYRSLGFYVPSCDSNLTTGGQRATVVGDGAFCKDLTSGGSDQTASVSTQSLPCAPIAFSGDFGMDVAGVK